MSILLRSAEACELEFFTMCFEPGFFDRANEPTALLAGRASGAVPRPDGSPLDYGLFVTSTHIYIYDNTDWTQYYVKLNHGLTANITLVKELPVPLDPSHLLTLAFEPGPFFNIPNEAPHQDMDDLPVPSIDFSDLQLH